MSAETTSYVPSWAISCWVDAHVLYFSLPGQNGPVVVSFARHELSKALTILFDKYEVEGHGEVYIPPANPVSKKLASEGVTPKDMAAAREAMKALGLLK